MKAREIDMTKGAMFPNIVRFAIPIILSNILQITFNATDVAVIGWFRGSNAVASIGATTSFIHLLLNLFIGLATGTTIAVSYALGTESRKDASEHSNNAIALSLISGIFISIVGIIAAKPVLTFLGTPEGEILDGAIKYFRIYFAGAPVLLLYNFGAAILRANGDSKRPFIFLTTGGVINILLNLFFVLVFKMSVDGVAVATVISNAIAAFLVLRTLIKTDGPCKVTLNKIKIYKDKLLIVFKFGLPAGIQSCMFSIPNIIIQSSINTFGAAAIAGNTAASNIGGYYDITTAAFAETTLTFVARNFGAGLHKRVAKACKICILSAFWVSLLLGVASYIIREPLLSIFVPNNAEAIRYGNIRLFFLALPNFIGAIMSVLTAALRGIGKPFFPMVTTIFGVCVVRVIWLMTVFRIYPTIECVYFTYPFTWTITGLILGVYLLYSYNKIKNIKPIKKGI